MRGELEKLPSLSHATGEPLIGYERPNGPSGDVEDPRPGSISIVLGTSFKDLFWNCCPDDRAGAGPDGHADGSGWDPEGAAH
jgi:hypothetical protein